MTDKKQENNPSPNQERLPDEEKESIKNYREENMAFDDSSKLINGEDKNGNKH